MSVRSVIARFGAVLFAASLLQSSTADAQALASGTVVALRSPSGRWLSADPQGNIYLSTNANPGGWEEWQYVSDPNGPVFISFHGTQIFYAMANTNSGTPKNVHGAPASVDTVLTMGVNLDANGRLLNSLTPTANGQIMLTLPVPQASYSFMLTDANGAVGWSTAPNYPTWYPSVMWKVVPISAPASERASRRKGVDDGGNFHLRAVSDGSVIAGSNQPAPPQPAVHAATEAIRPLPAVASSFLIVSTGKGLSYGQPVWIRWLLADGSQWSLQPDPRVVAGQVPPVRLDKIAYTAADQWTIVDPAGIAPNGMHVPQGVPICFKSVAKGTLLSANPGDPLLRQSPNTCNTGGTWEQFVISQ